ncbi:MAG: transcriptional regulator [Promethearchaeota archaeon]
MSFPCETAIWKALPAIRSALAQALVEQKITQRKIAELLSTTEASISHYIKGKRGAAIMLGPPIHKDINYLAERIAAGSISQEDMVERMCTLCRKVRQSCAVCAAESPEECQTCTLL